MFSYVFGLACSYSSSVSLQHDVNAREIITKEHPDSCRNIRHELKQRFMTLENGFDLRCHNILLSCSVPVQSNFIFFSKESAELSRLHKITDRHDGPCAAVR